jgi:hypothetical protein
MLFQKELYNRIPNVAVWLMLRKRFHNTRHTIEKLFLEHPVFKTTIAEANVCVIA